jgi:hypothetical protein
LFLAVAYLSAGLGFFVSTQVGAVLGAFLGARVAALGEDRAAGGFGSLLLAAQRCDMQEALRRRLIDGGGWFPVVGAAGIGLRVFAWAALCGDRHCDVLLLVSRGVGGRFFEVGGARGTFAGVAALAGGSETWRRGEFRVWRRLCEG